MLVKLCKNVSHLTLQVGLSSGAAAWENNLAIVEKLKIAILDHPSEFCSRCVLRRNEKCAPQKLDRIVHCSIIPKNSQQESNTNVRSLMKKPPPKKRSPHAMECYSAVKRNAVSIHGTACWPLKMLCYVKEERHKASMMCEFTYQNVQNRQIHRDRSKDVRITESLAVHLKLIQHCRSTICELKHIFS